MSLGNLLGTTSGTGGPLGTLGTILQGIVDPILPGTTTGNGGTTNAVDTVLASITDLLGGTGTAGGGLLGNLLGDGLLAGTQDGSILGVGLLGEDGAVTLDVLGTRIAVLPGNGGIAAVNVDGLIDDGSLLDLGGIIGEGGLLNTTGLVGDEGLIRLDGVLEKILELLGDGTGPDPDDYTDADGNIDPSKFEKVFIGTNGRDQVSVTQDVSTYVDGKAGIDTVTFGRSAADLTVTVGANAVMFTDKDSLFYFNDVERVKFFEGSLYLDTGVGENAGVAYRLYQAAFDRAPDNNGVKFWVQRLDDGVSWKDAAGGFVNSNEFKQTYGTLSNQQFVNEIYQNVLGRDADAAGSQFWLDYLEANKGDRAGVLLGFSESGENVALVGQVIADGYTVA